MPESPPKAERLVRWRTGLSPPVSLSAAFPQRAGSGAFLPAGCLQLPRRGWGHVPASGWKLLLLQPPKRNLTVSSICPEGKAVWAQVYPNLQRYHDLPPIRNHSSYAEDYLAAQFVPFSAAEMRQTGRGVLYGGVFFVGFSATVQCSPHSLGLCSAIHSYCCPIYLQDKELTPFFQGSVGSS